jgi:hypothetical protein
MQQSPFSTAVVSISQDFLTATTANALLIWHSTSYFLVHGYGYGLFADLLLLNVETHTSQETVLFAPHCVTCKHRILSL